MFCDVTTLRSTGQYLVIRSLLSRALLVKMIWMNKVVGNFSFVIGKNHILFVLFITVMHCIRRNLQYHDRLIAYCFVICISFNLDWLARNITSCDLYFHSAFGFFRKGFCPRTWSKLEKKKFVSSSKIGMYMQHAYVKRRTPTHCHPNNSMSTRILFWCYTIQLHKW